MDFIDENKVPLEVLKYRNRSAILEAYDRNNDEKIILYRKLVSLKRKSLDEVSEYATTGINDILRFNVTSFTAKMDNPEVLLFVLNENEQYGIVNAEKIYFMNLLIQLKNEDQLEYRRYRIIFNRDGIKEIETL
ncbi:MAG: hypothetical protein CVT92_07165 [Bacteroidetes bacterium HGW-Bacteroidetes-1]|jgi:hypothetical protein|nr:MAG: hypothetical protein CVT92_07165 [Bacteroidetes bacterium HGW-Bacteroidetes-1]